MVNEVVNIREAKNLVEVYRNITKEKLLKYYDATNPKRALTCITNFGTSRCHLCSPILDAWNTCKGCIYEVKYHNKFACADETYFKIVDASNIDELLEAIRKRADYLESIIKEYEVGE